MKNYIKILLMVAVTGLVCQTSRAQDSVGKDDVDSASMSSSGDEVASTAQSYGIRPGDTMWDICKIVLDNPWYWPKLWSLNQYILNPNLIFPGNQLVFSPATDTSFQGLML